MPDEGAWADDEAGAAFGAAAIVGGDFGAWNAVRGAGARDGAITMRFGRVSPLKTKGRKSVSVERATVLDMCGMKF